MINSVTYFVIRHFRVFFILIFSLIGNWCQAQNAPAVKQTTIVAADTVWMLVASILVILMIIPGLALFYSGMVRRKNALSIVAQTLGSCCVVGMVWIAAGYSLAFSGTSPYIGDLSSAFFKNFFDESSARVHFAAPTIPEASFALFHLTFAMITAALILGAVAERFRFIAAITFSGLWCLLVYVPVARWVWHPNGWLHSFGHLDYAGGTVVHLSAGVAGLLLAYTLKQRKGYGVEPMEPSNLLMTITGAGLLWIGWFGFNGGSGLAADIHAVEAVLITQIAACAGIFGWLIVEYYYRKRVSMLGMASGMIAGLIAITPASGFVDSVPALMIGIAAGIVCFFSVTKLKQTLNYDDSLDVFGLHGVAGILGTLLTGVFASGNLGPHLPQMIKQLIGVGVVVGYVFAMTWIVLLILVNIMKLRVSEEEEEIGLDLVEHGESLE